MKDEFREAPAGIPTDTDGTFSPLPDCRWNLKNPRSYIEPDSCGCYVDPCVYFGISPEDGCVDADVHRGD